MSRSPVLPAWEQGAAPRLIRLAARNAPPDLAARLEEEWLADLSATGGAAERWRMALGCCWAALVIRHEHRPARSLSLASSTGARIMMGYAYRGASRVSSAKAPVVGGQFCDINTTPLIDVLLVLLITLILTLPIMTHAVKLDLTPVDGPPPDPVPEVIDLDVDFDGAVAWNGTAVASFPQLDSYFSTEARKIPQPEVHLRADRSARYDVVARVLASAQQHGLRRIGFVDTGSFKDN
jgi:biopolymer transport protein ExbD